MKKILFLFLVCCCLAGCRNEHNVVIEDKRTGETSVQIAGKMGSMSTKTVEVDGIEYLIWFNNADEPFAVCPKVNGKHNR